jgi:uroporphyrinogen decarboxylase
MNSSERLRATLEHQIPDRIPFDLGGTPMSGIHINAYTKLIEYLGYENLEAEVYDQIQQLALPHEQVLKRLKVDVRPIRPRSPQSYTLEIQKVGAYSEYTDEWGVRWRKPVSGGYYYDMVAHPLAQAQTLADIENYAWIDPQDQSRYTGLQQAAAGYAKDGYGVLHWSIGAGVSETHAWLRGFEKYYTDFYLNPDIAEAIMSKVVDIKIAYWENALSRSGKYVDVIVEADDLAGQTGPLISPKIYRQFIKPQHTRLFAAIKKTAPHVKIFFHSCGAVQHFIPDFIESGIDILNPVQISATGMDLRELKREFGKDLVFWGGGVDTQRAFDRNEIEAVKEDVRRNIAALKPDGGFVFTPVHNTQANVPPQNYMAMWETLQEEGPYR